MERAIRWYCHTCLFQGLAQLRTFGLRVRRGRLALLQRGQQHHPTNCAQPWIREQRLGYLYPSAIVPARYAVRLDSYYALFDLLQRSQVATDLDIHDILGGDHLLCQHLT